VCPSFHKTTTRCRKPSSESPSPRIPTHSTGSGGWGTTKAAGLASRPPRAFYSSHLSTCALANARFKLSSQLHSPNGHVNLLNRPRAVPAMVLMCICECECVGLCDRSNAGSRPHVTRRRVTRGHLFSESARHMQFVVQIRADQRRRPDVSQSPNRGPAHHVP
jgi:hypothetical protein